VPGPSPRSPARKPPGPGTTPARELDQLRTSTAAELDRLRASAEHAAAEVLEEARADLRRRAERSEAEAGALRRERDELRAALEGRGGSRCRPLVRVHEAAEAFRELAEAAAKVGKCVRGHDVRLGRRLPWLRS